jgi:hypothetical protein
VARSQLNIKIDPDLLQRVKAHATRQGKTDTEFVAQVLMEAVSEDRNASHEERLARIEKHLGLDG